MFAFAMYAKIQADKDKMTNAFYIINYFFVRILSPLILILIFYPVEVLRSLYGVKWVEGSSILGYFAIYAAFLPLFSNAKTLAYSLGKLLDVSKLI